MISLASPQASAETLQADLDAQQREGYGRLVLTFRNRTLLPSYDARVSSGVLRVSFEDAVDVKVSNVPVVLSDYISVARRDPDGTGIRLALKNDLRINTMEAGEKLFIDLLPSNWEGMPPGLPDDVVQELARRAEEALRRVRELEQSQLQSRAGPRVALRIGEHPTFTRLVFDWSVRFDSKFVREGDLVKVIFNHDIGLDLSDLRAHLPNGVVDATSFSADGSLNFLMRVNPGVDIRAFREDNTYVLDIVQPLSDESLPTADTGASEPGRVTDRISAPGTVTQKPTGPAVVGQVPERETPEAQPAEIVPPVDEIQTNAVNVAAPVSAQPRPKATRPDTVSAGSQTAPEQIAPEQAATPAPGQAAASAEPVAPPAQAEPAVEVVSEPQVAAPQQVAVVETGSRPDVDAVAPVPALPAPAAPDALPEGISSISELIDANSYTGTKEAPKRMSPLAQLSAGETTAPSLVTPEEVNPEAFSDEQVAEIRNFVSVEARRIGDTVRVVFPFAEPVAAAVFRRGNSVWLVFDTDVPIDLRAIQTAMGKTMEAMEVIEQPGWQAINLRLADRALTTIGADGSGWVLTIGDMILEPSRPLQLERNIRGDGASALRVPFGDPRNTHVLEDKAVGDKIMVVTGLGPARGLLKSQSFVELQSLTSAHGLAFVPHVDDLVVSYAGDDVIVARDGGLSLSKGHLADGTGVLQNTDAEQPEQPGFIDFSRFIAPDFAAYQRMLQRLEGNVAALPAKERKAARMDLARFQLANRFAHEAIGVLRLVDSESGIASNDPTFNLLMGASQVLARRPEDALKSLNTPELLDSPDAAVWRMLADASLDKWTDARLGIARGQAVIGNYPDWMLTEFNLTSAKSLVEVNDFGTAAAFLAEVDSDAMTRSQAARYDLLRGRIADAAGRFEEALRAFDIVARSEDRPGAAEAQYRAMRVRYRDGEITADQAIDKLEGLTTIWRGDDTELQALRFLGQLYAEKGRYRQAFTALRAAVLANPESHLTRLMQEEMNGVFTALFLNGKADELEPIDALALYYDFRELTPIGRDGDEMVRRLADRLVSVDLLDQAAKLLQHQVDNRLKGAARAQIAADLGLVYLLDRQPEKALAVLNRTRQAHLPRSLDRQRRIVEARALTDTGRADLALELLGNLRGSEIDRQRADTLWSGERWQEAGEQLEGMHGVRWSDPLQLDEQERLDILRAAIAYSLAGDQLGLDRLRSKYVSKMSDSPSGAAFDIVTRPIESKGVEFMSIAKEIAAVDTLESFLTEYRRHYLNTGPGEGLDGSAPDPAPATADTTQANPSAG